MNYADRPTKGKQLGGFLTRVNPYGRLPRARLKGNCLLVLVRAL
jgi:hypothetical protein